MKINMTQELLDVDGKPINSTKECVILDMEGNIIKKGGKEVITVITTDDSLTLKKICVDALLMNSQDEKISGEDKAKRYQLAMKIHGAKKDVDLESGDITTIKEIIGKNYGPIVVGQTHLMLENKKLPV